MTMTFRLRLAVLPLFVALGQALLVPAVVAAADPVAPPVSTTSSPPGCRIADTPARYRTLATWSRTLLDWRYRLPATYAPTDLVSTSRAGLGGGGSVRAFVIPDLTAMRKAAAAAHAPIAVNSAYRSYAAQASLFAGSVRRYGYAAAIRDAARAGHSEHQLGTTLDFRFLAATSKAWLAAHAWQYGFVMSYPPGRSAQTCYGYEPWHYRYFGRAVAAAIHGSGLTTRVWLWRHGAAG